MQPKRIGLLLSAMLLLPVILVACGGNAPEAANDQVLVISAIPDQDPEKLQRLYDSLAQYLEEKLGVSVEYKPVTDYAASVTAFKVGEVDMVWFGGLTGVQARLQVPGAEAIAQRESDAQFHSVIIANVASGLQPFDNIAGLATLKGHTFTFGSESSTSGRLMPQSFLEQAGVSLDDFKGEPGFSGAHDKTIELVEAGTFDAGALNEQVWQDRVANGDVDLDKVILLWRTPPFYDYHWVIRPEVNDRYGSDFVDRVQSAFLELDAQQPDQQAILDLFNAQKFIETSNENYAQIERVARSIGKIK